MTTDPVTNDMVYDGAKRLEIYDLIQGLGDAVRNSDLSSVRGYRQRLALIIETADPSDPAKPLYDAVEDVFRSSGEWVRGVVVKWDDLRAKKQIQEAVDYAIRLLNVS